MRRLTNTLWISLITALILYAVPFSPLTDISQAGEISNRSLTLATSEPDATTQHTFGFDIVSSDNIGSIRFEYCANSPIIGDVCIPPVGLDVSSPTIISQTGETGFSINALQTNANRIVIERPAVAPIPGPVTYQFGNVVNPSGINTSFFARVTTYTNTSGLGAFVDSGGLAVSTAQAINIGAYVPPILTFCVGATILANDCGTATGFFVNFGAFDETVTRTATSKFLAYTNAEFGYAITVIGTTMTSGNNVIPALSNRTSSQTGVPQFGLNLRANTTPNVGLEPTGPGTATPAPEYSTVDNYKFVSGDTVAVSTLPTDRKTFTASYIVNIDSNQPKGFYSTTLTYVATATF